MNFKSSIPKNRVIETLKANWEAHVQRYEAAVRSYKERLQRRVREECARIDSEYVRRWAQEREVEERSEEELLSHPRSFAAGEYVEVFIPVPFKRDHDYMLAIQMLVQDISDHVELTASDFDRFMLDNWEWSSDFNEACPELVEEAAEEQPEEQPEETQEGAI